MLLCHALSPYEEELCSFWERLISSQKTNITSCITNLGEDGVKRCSLMVEHGSRVMSNGNQKWFSMCCTSQAYNRQSLSDAQPITCINHGSIFAREGLWGASGVRILVCLTGTWRDLCLFMPFYEGLLLGQQLGAMCVPSSMLRTWFLSRKQS